MSDTALKNSRSVGRPNAVYGWPLLSLVCLLALVAVQSILFSYGYRLTADDDEAYYYTLGSAGEIFEYARHMAQFSGRIGHYLTLPLNMASAYASDYFPARVGIAALFFASYMAFAAFIGRLMRMPSITLPLCVAFLACSPLLFSHTPPTAYPLQITLPFLVILLCRHFFIVDRKGIAAILVRAIWLVAIVMGSEYTFLFSAGVLLVEHAIRNSDDLKAAFRSRLLWMDAGTMAMALAIYASYRLSIPVDYIGNRPDGLADIRSVVTILWLHTWNGTIFPYLAIDKVMESWKILAAASVSAAFAGAPVLLSPTTGKPRTRLVIVVSIALLLAWLCVMLPSSSNKRLHDWCFVSSECTYTTSRLAYYFFIPAIFIPIIVYFNRSVLALMLAMVAFLGFSHNWKVSIDQRAYVIPYRQAADSACFIDPENARSVLDPGNHISLHPWVDRSSFWARIVTHERAKKSC